MSKITAPFTEAQVAILNRYQLCGIMHPFTCGTAGCRMPLIATIHGWECAYCQYTQGWAHEWMADEEIVARLEIHRGILDIAAQRDSLE